MSGVYSDGHRRRLAGRAMTLVERLERPDTLERTDRTTAEVETMFDAWVDLFPTEKAFDRRLERAGLTREACKRAMAGDTLAPTEPIPDWVQTLETVIEGVQAYSPRDVPERTGSKRAGDAESPTPDRTNLDERTSTSDCSDLHERTSAQDGDASEPTEAVFGKLSMAVALTVRELFLDNHLEARLSEGAIDAMTEWFRRRFAMRAIRVLYVEFKTFVSVHDEELATASPSEFEDPPTEYYDAFNAYLFDGGFGDLCQQYPMLGRMLVTQIRQWTEHLAEFAERMSADRDALAERFDVSGSLGPVRTLEPLADDTHGDGRAITRVEFECGLTVVYKPRPVRAGIAFYDVLERLDEHLPLSDLRTPTYLDCGEYGWMEWVESEACQDEDGVRRYYERAGVLCCLAHLLEFPDNHLENLVVSGEQPVLVDAETICHPYLSADEKPIGTTYNTLLDESVLSTHLLPYSTTAGAAFHDQDGAPGRAGAMVPLGRSTDEVTIEGMTVPSIRAPNTDVMVVEQVSPTVDPTETMPAVDGTAHPTGAYVDELVEGFVRTYETIIDLRDGGILSEEIGLFDRLSAVPNRIVYRATKEYMSVIQAQNGTGCLADGARFGIEIERLAVPFCDGRVSEPAPWPLFEAEREAIMRYDPPRFTSGTDDVSLYFDGRDLGVEAELSGLARARERIESADQADVREQAELLRGCFETTRDSSDSEMLDAESRDSEMLDAESRDSATPNPVSGTNSGAISDEQLLEVATDMFETIQDAAVRTPGGTYHWGPVAPNPPEDPLKLTLVDGTLYAGRSGLALFPAALFQCTGAERYRQFALDVLEPVRRDVHSDHSQGALARHGGCIGVGSVAYSLAVAGALLDDETVLADARRVVTHVADSLLEHPRPQSVFAGTAGTILGFLGTYERCEDEAFRSVAITCGDALLESRTTLDSGHRVWRADADEPPVSGISHGTDGIVYALGRLGAAVDEPRFSQAAVEAVEYEAARASLGRVQSSEHSWSDGYTDGWCHGRAGIGLARIGLAESVPDSCVERDLERLAKDVRVDPLLSTDTCCCGNAGLAELLLELQRHRGVRAGDARRLLGRVVANRAATGRSRTNTRCPRVIDPTFGTGLAGLGYAMCRVHVPETLPCVLRWE